MKHVTLPTTQATLSLAACDPVDTTPDKDGTPSMPGADVRTAVDHPAGQVC